MSDFNADFWVVAGTSGPVLALSHGVLFERFFSMTLSGDTLRQDLRSRLPRRRKRVARFLFWMVVRLPMRVAQLGVLASAVSFLLAVLALAQRSDLTIVLTEIALIVAGCLMLIQPLVGAMSRSGLRLLGYGEDGQPLSAASKAGPAVE